MRRAELYGGGTALGAVQVASAEELDRRYGMPDEVHGTSVGSLTGAMRAAGRLGRLREIWTNEIRGARSFQQINVPDLWRGFFNLVPLRRMLKKELTPSDFETEVFAHVVDLATKRYEAIRLNELSQPDMIDALICSATQHGLHEPARFQGRLKADGGAKHVIPILRRPWEHFNTIHVVTCSPLSGSTIEAPPSQDEIGIARGLEILVDTIETSDSRALTRWVERGVDVWVTSPVQRPGDPFDASQDTIRWRLDTIGPAAWRNTRRVLPRSGLHLSEAEAADLGEELRSFGVDLTALLKQIRQPTV